MKELLIQEYERAGKVEGYSYLILDERGRGLAAGYYRFRKHAEYYGKLVLSMMRESE